MEEENTTRIEEQDYMQDISLTGDLVMSLKNKAFVIAEKPQYEISPDLDNPARMKRKMTIMIKLIEVDAVVKYYPNKTSRDTIMRKQGLKLEDWIGFEGEFYTEKMRVGKEQKNVVFIK